MGARPEDYADIAPPHSYIHVDDFRSTRDLADYLNILDVNDTAYNEYFRWKSDLAVVWDTRYWCRLCALLHAVPTADKDAVSPPCWPPSPYVHWYQDYGTWWNGVCTGRWAVHNGARWRTWRNCPSSSLP